ncbi:putative neuropeptide receptor [Nephila pilipes]|uniref:Putative neuropeptide receptor n=1 Tax=Nephila pilipes TaxID=299642 RepID=A0A8X6PHW4_NEPPI|nr:putative neuropeptide receptor [Nephila pilipes]
MNASTLTLSAIACEQFKAVMFPLQTRNTNRRHWITITCIWMVSTLVSIPFLLVKKYRTYQSGNFPEVSCDEDWDYLTEIYDGTYTLKQLYYTLLTISLFFLPAIVMIVLYVIIACRISRREVPGEANISNVNVHQQAKKKVKNILDYI